MLLNPLYGKSRGKQLRSALVRTIALMLIVLAAVSVAAEPYEVDTTRTRIPRRPGKSLGDKIFYVPSAVLTSPFVALKGATKWTIKHYTEYRSLQKFFAYFLGGKSLLYPIVNLSSNSGLEGGLGLRLKTPFALDDRLGFKFSYSTHKYQDYSVTYTHPTLFGSNSEVSMVGRYAKLTQEDFYGTGTDSFEDNKVSYGLERTSFRVDLHWQNESPVSGTWYAAYTAANLFDGQDESVDRNLDTIRVRFGMTPDDFRKTRYWAFGGVVRHDWRDKPGRTTAGGYVAVDLSFNKGAGDESDDLQFLRVQAEWRQYLHLFRRRVVMFRLMGKGVEAIGNAIENPFYLQPTLGSQIDLRGYRTDRLRDNFAFVASVEYRYPVWETADGFLFLDEGRVFQSLEDDFTLDNWRYGAGIGIRFWGKHGEVGRLTFAVSRESIRFYLSLGAEL